MISGPSGVGKGPAIEWTKRLYPGLHQVYVRKTKTERHNGNETDLGFLNQNGAYHQFDCRGTEQRIYLDELDSAIESHGVVLIEAYYKTLNFLKLRYASTSDFVPTFISPLEPSEIAELSEQGKTLEDYLPELMFDTLVRRAVQDGKSFTRLLYLELEKRAKDSVDEVKSMSDYLYVIPNRCYAHDPRWRLPVLVGEPRKVVTSIKNIATTGYLFPPEPSIPVKTGSKRAAISSNKIGYYDENNEWHYLREGD